MTHHPDTQHVSETGLMIHILQQSVWTRACICGHVCVCVRSFPGKKTIPSLCSRPFAAADGGLRCQEMSQKQQTLFEYSYLCRDMYHFHNVCEFTWQELIITSGLKREQPSSCASMSSFSDTYQKI